METLNREEIESQVIDLYCNQKKTYREIQKIVRKSPRDIKAILKKVEPEHSSLSTPSQAYQLYSEHKSPIEVAVRLNISEPEATQFYREYWRLNQLYDLDKIYEEIRGNLASLVDLFRKMKTAGMNIAHVIKLLSMANNDLQSIEYRCQELGREAASLEASNRNAARTLEQLTYVISETQNTLDHYESQCKQQRFEMDRLFDQKTQLEEFVECFKNNDVEYVKVKGDIKQEVENNLTNPKQLLRLALLALIESLRKDPNKFQLLYYQMSTDIMATIPSQLLTQSYSSQNYSVSNMNKKPFQDYNNPTEAFQSFVLNEAGEIYEKLLDNSIDRNISKVRTEPYRVINIPSSKKTAAYTYRKEEEHAYIESEIGNENTTQDDESRFIV